MCEKVWETKTMTERERESKDLLELGDTLFSSSDIITRLQSSLAERRERGEEGAATVQEREAGLVGSKEFREFGCFLRVLVVEDLKKCSGKRRNESVCEMRVEGGKEGEETFECVRNRRGIGADQSKQSRQRACSDHTRRTRCLCHFPHFLCSSRRFLYL